VVRRHLAATMKMLVMAPAKMEAPAADQLAAVLARNDARFRIASTVSITHVFVSLRRGRTQAESVARQLSASLRSGDVPPGEAPRRGDGFALGHRLDSRTNADLAAVFGARFAEAVAALAPHSWSEPIESSYGFHLVWVDTRSPARMPPLDAVRSRVLELFREERAEARLHAWLAGQRKRYRIRIEEPQAGEPQLAAASLPVKDLSLPRAALEVGD
jgi:peptidyl-prolyl cis-trans isomerase C